MGAGHLQFNWYKGVVTNLEATSVILDGSLVGYWPLDNDTLDYGLSNDGTNNGATFSPSGGQISGAFEFVKVEEDFIQIDRSSGDFDYDESTSFSVALWAKPSDFVSASVSGLNMTVRQFSTSGRFAWWMNPATTVLDKNFFTSDFVSFPAIPNDSYSHVAMTYDSSTLTMRAYVNGVEQGSTLWTLGDIPPADSFLAIGNDVNELDRGFNGTIDEVMILDRNLSPNEITQLFRGAEKGGNKLSSDLTSVGETWILGVTGGDFLAFGEEVFSNPIVIFGPGDDEDEDDDEDSDTGLPNQDFPVGEGSVSGGAMSLGEGNPGQNNEVIEDTETPEDRSGIRRNKRRGR